MAYDSRQMLQLLKIASWVSESELEFSGFKVLQNNLDAKIRNNGGSANKEIPDQKYLGQLLKDVERNIEAGIQTGKSAAYIQKLITYIEFSDWAEYAKKYAVVNSCIDLTKIDSSNFKEANICFVLPESKTEAVKKAVNYAQSKIALPITFNSLKATEPKEIIEILSGVLKTNQFVVFCISDDWDADLAIPKNSALFSELLNKGQLIPIRIGEEMAVTTKRLSFNPNFKPPSGKIGLLTALAVIEASDDIINPIEKVKKAPVGSKFNVGKFINNGTVATGDMKQENHGGNNVLGGNIIQHFHSKDD